MWNINVRPYGEYFAKGQAVTTAPVMGNQADNNPTRLENSQGGTGIRVCVPIGGSLAVAAGETLTLTVEHADDPAGAFTVLGTAVFTGETGGRLFNGDETVTEFILPTIAKPHVRVKISGSAAPAGAVDIFPVYVSRPPSTK